MSAFHLHIRGRVQGVGFRPAVAGLARARQLAGTVSNGRDGVHIVLHTCETVAREFLDQLLAHPPQHSIITGYTMEAWETAQEAAEAYPHDQHPTPYTLPTTTHHPPPTTFDIIDSDPSTPADLLLTPDIALCPDCRAELTQQDSRRLCYAFITCLHCGPRYSITTALPYDRAHTTMAGLAMCPECSREYTDIDNRRHYSQTNSCPDCAIPMHWYPTRGLESPLTRQFWQDQDSHQRRSENGGVDPETIHTQPPAQSHKTAPDEDQEHPASSMSVFDRQHAVIHEVADALKDGQIIAVKGIGGYLLLADATREDVVQTLRHRKHRPRKPFAIMYPDLVMAMVEHDIRPVEVAALESPIAPIVLVKKRSDPPFNNLHSSLFTLPSSPWLARSGLFLPYTGLLTLIARRVARPLVATSGNISGSPILYRDEAALDLLWDVADGILAFDRDIVTPQDDSVWQFNDAEDRIILRRSRGMAPDYYPHALGHTDATIFAAGADLKSAFAIHHRDKIYLSQYLGDLEDYRAQQAWNHTRDHLLQLTEAQPTIVLTDLHPGYYSRQEALAAAEAWNATVVAVPHHEAHIAAVMEENELLNDPKPLLGLAWDGTGYGTDGQSWGSEGFIVQDGDMDRVLHLDYFPQLLGDKMSREPRLSALSLLHGQHDARMLLQDQFTATEWDYYQKLLDQPNPALTSSMGRLIDGVAAILGVCAYNTYEGEAAMTLEALASGVDMEISTPYPFTIRQDRVDWRPMLRVLLGDLYSHVPKEIIARRFFASLAQLVVDTAYSFDINRIALSGGVFQNALLLDLIRQRLPADIQVYTHQQLSPNDECIALGQLAWYQLKFRDSIPHERDFASLNPLPPTP